MIGENGNPVTDELTDDEMELFEENEDMVQNVLQKAYDMWRYYITVYSKDDIRV